MEISSIQQQAINANIKPANLESQNNLGVSDAKIRAEELKKTSKELEGYFITYLFKSMEKNISSSWMSEEQSKGLAGMMFSQVMGEAVAQQGGIGLSDIIYNNLMNMDQDNLVKIKEEIATKGVDQNQNLREINKW